MEIKCPAKPKVVILSPFQRKLANPQVSWSIIRVTSHHNWFWVGIKKKNFFQSSPFKISCLVWRKLIFHLEWFRDDLNALLSIYSYCLLYYLLNHYLFKAIQNKLLACITTIGMHSEWAFAERLPLIRFMLINLKNRIRGWLLIDIFNIELIFSWYIIVQIITRFFFFFTSIKSFALCIWRKPILGWWSIREQSISEHTFIQ